ncbi:MAG: TetR/AcrR family transcriptional regulator [Marinovum sp.]|nr:TetR/AcrR family transcriptional regulator [Marinovum sp.]
MKHTSDDPKRTAILTAAMQVISTYGYRKTSMEDIARAAGMSRPALYQHFANKDAIYRACCEVLFLQKIKALKDALSQDGPPSQLLTRAITAEMGPLMKDILSSPHGPEIMKMSQTVAQDIISNGVAEVTAILEGFFERHGARDPDGMAMTFEAAKMGLHESVPSYDVYIERLETLARAFGALIEAQAMSDSNKPN